MFCEEALNESDAKFRISKVSKRFFFKHLLEPILSLAQDRQYIIRKKVSLLID